MSSSAGKDHERCGSGDKKTDRNRRSRNPDRRPPPLEALGDLARRAEGCDRSLFCRMPCGVAQVALDLAEDSSLREEADA
jgi:hypothetical protein